MHEYGGYVVNVREGASVIDENVVCPPPFSFFRDQLLEI